jgi:hypothetical protein
MASSATPKPSYNVRDYLRTLSDISPTRDELVEKWVEYFLKLYASFKESKGITFSDGTMPIPALDSHGLCLIAIKDYKDNLLEAGIIEDVLNNLCMSIPQLMEVTYVKLSTDKPMPAFREFACAKLVDGKYCDIRNYTETTHVIINI